jgi:hypothetical protein
LVTAPGAPRMRHQLLSGLENIGELRLSLVVTLYIGFP